MPRSSRSGLIFLLVFCAVLLPLSASADDGKGTPPPTRADTDPPEGLTGGPNTYGYTWIDKNSPGGPNSDGIRYQNIATTGTAINPTPDRDDGTAALPIPFTFRFFGVDYSNVTLCANGYLAFTGPNCDATPHNGSSEPTNYIAGWWADLDGRCAGSQFHYQTVGTAPARRFIVQWTAMGHYSNLCTAAFLSTFQIVLHETSNIIEVLHNGTVGTTTNTHYVEIGQVSTTALTAYSSATAPGADWGVMFLPPATNQNAGAWTCSSPRTAIPDINTTGITNNIVIPTPAGSDITDLNVFLQIPHSFVDDLRVTLTHVETNKTVTLLQGHCGSSQNVGGLVLDDEASGIPACYTVPAIGTTGSGRPTQVLSAFDGGRWSGTWRLNVADLSTVDVGTLMQWCLNPTLVPTAVTLVNFDGQALEDRVALTWETASESNLLGFNLYRSEDEVRPDTPLNGALIESQSPGGGQGAIYTYDDYAIAPHATYTYWLEDVALDGTRSVHDPITVTMAPPTAISLATWQVAAGGQNILIGGITLGVAGLVLLGWRRGVRL